MLQSAMGLVVTEMPVETGVMVPFLPLPELTAHEQHLFAGMAVHVAIEQPEVGKSLPHVAGHLVEQRSFAVDHFVMREGQDEILTEGVE